jgi:hypothetical protein
MTSTYYKWLAESIVMTDRTTVNDLLAAIKHAKNTAGEHITPAQADRLGKLAAEIHRIVG